MSEKHDFCQLNAEKFCIICAQVVKRASGYAFSLIIDVYKSYFGKEVAIPIPGRFVPHVACGSCYANLMKWKRGAIKDFCIVKPAIWKEPATSVDCFFCRFDLSSKQWPSNVSTIAPQRRAKRSTHQPRQQEEHSKSVTPSSEFEPETPILARPQRSTSKRSFNEYIGVVNCDDQSCDYFPNGKRTKTNIEPQPFDESELTNLLKDIKLDKSDGEVLFSRLKSRGVVTQGSRVTFLRKFTTTIEEFFEYEETHKFVYCKDIPGLVKKYLGHFDRNEWRLFCDGSSKHFLCGLIHNGNKLPSIPIVFARDPKESYVKMKKIFQAIKYRQLNLAVIADFKMLNILRGLMGGYPRFFCIYCLWNSREHDKHYRVRKWPTRPAKISKGNKRRWGRVTSPNGHLPE